MERVTWIDISKALGIFFVITVHAIIPAINPITIHLSSFTIPLFFFITGLTYSNEKYRDSISQYIIRRGRRLMIPYFLLYLLMILLFIPLAGLIDTYLTPDQLIFWLLYGAGPPDSSTHLWFLQVLFFGLSLFVIIDHYLIGRSRIWKGILPPVLATGTFVLDVLFQESLVPWRLGSVLLATAFILIGNETRYIFERCEWTIPVRESLIGIILLSITLVLLSTINGFTDMAVDNYGYNIGLYLVNGTLGSVLIIFFASLLSRVSKINDIMTPIGNHTQEIYELHPLPFLLAPFIITSVLGDSFYEPLLWVVRFTLSILIIIPLAVYLVRKSRLARFILRGSFEED